MKEWAQQFYHSNAWVQCRHSFMASRFFICNRCEGAATIAHHIIYLTPKNINDQDITLNWDNLEALCQDCHNREHHASEEEVVRQGLRFNMYGDIVEDEYE